MADDTPGLRDLIVEFLSQIAAAEIEIYNEASIQFELAIWLRRRIGSGLKVQLERNVAHFGADSVKLEKSEMDIVVFSPDRSRRQCIEIKFPRQGQHPEQMFSFCKDLLFLEQLVSTGFDSSYLLAVADDRLFWDGPDRSGIYSHFRGGKPIIGEIRKPTGEKDKVLCIQGSHSVVWHDLGRNMKYLLIEVCPPK